MTGLSRHVRSRFEGLVSVAFALALAAFPSGALAASPTVFDFPTTGTPTVAAGINSNGSIVGFYSTGGTFSGFQLANGKSSTINVTDSTATEAHGVSGSGQIVGAYQDATGAVHGFQLSGKTTTTLDAPGADRFTKALGISSKGIVGWYVDSAQTSFGFLFDGVSFSTIQPSGAFFTIASGIDSTGRIVGVFLDSAGIHGFVLVNGVFTPLDVPGALYTAAQGTASPGGIVGSYGIMDGEQFVVRGFFLPDKTSTFITFSVCGTGTGSFTEASGVSTNGFIVGTCGVDNGVDPPQTHAFVWKP